MAKRKGIDPGTAQSYTIRYISNNGKKGQALVDGLRHNRTALKKCEEFFLTNYTKEKFGKRIKYYYCVILLPEFVKYFDAHHQAKAREALMAILNAGLEVPKEKIEYFLCKRVPELLEKYATKHLHHYFKKHLADEIFKLTGKLPPIVEEVIKQLADREKEFGKHANYPQVLLNGAKKKESIGIFKNIPPNHLFYHRATRLEKRYHLKLLPRYPSHSIIGEDDKFEYLFLIHVGRVSDMAKGVKLKEGSIYLRIHKYLRRDPQPPLRRHLFNKLKKWESILLPLRKFFIANFAKGKSRAEAKELKMAYTATLKAVIESGSQQGRVNSMLKAILKKGLRVREDNRVVYLKEEVPQIIRSVSHPILRTIRNALNESIKKLRSIRLPQKPARPKPRKKSLIEQEIERLVKESGRVPEEELVIQFTRPTQEMIAQALVKGPPKGFVKAPDGYMPKVGHIFCHDSLGFCQVLEILGKGSAMQVRVALFGKAEEKKLKLTYVSEDGEHFDLREHIYFEPEVAKRIKQQLAALAAKRAKTVVSLEEPEEITLEEAVEVAGVGKEGWRIKMALEFDARYYADKLSGIQWVLLNYLVVQEKPTSLEDFRAAKPHCGIDNYKELMDVVRDIWKEGIRISQSKQGFFLTPDAIKGKDYEKGASSPSTRSREASSPIVNSQPAASERNTNLGLRLPEKTLTLDIGGAMDNHSAPATTATGSGSAPNISHGFSAIHIVGNLGTISTFNTNPSENFLNYQTGSEYALYPPSSRSRRSPLAQSGLRLQRRSIGTSAGFCPSGEAEGLYFFLDGGSAFLLLGLSGGIK